MGKGIRVQGRMFGLLLSFVCMGCTMQEIHSEQRSVNRVCAPVEKEHSKPIDVAVLGNSLEAVTSALTAKKAGASVLLLSPAPTLGRELSEGLHLDALSEIPSWDTVTRDFYADAIRQIPARFQKIKDQSPDPRAVLTPNYGKVKLDSWLKDHGIPYLGSTYVSEVSDTKSGDGRNGIAPSPFVITAYNRSGRVQFEAKTVIDCREDSQDAKRRCGLRFVPGKHRFIRYVLSGEKPKNAQLLEVTAYSNQYPVNVPGWDVRLENAFPASYSGTLYRCVAEFELKTGSPLELAALEGRFRDLTFTPLQADSSHEIMPLEPLYQTFDVRQIATQIERGYYPCMRSVAPQILTPEELQLTYPRKLQAAAYRFGRMAAAQASGHPGGTSDDPGQIPFLKYRNTPVKKSASSSSPTPPHDMPSMLPLDVCEFVHGQTLGMSDVPLAMERETLPVLARTDVLVMGGGTAGAPAAIAASRAGVSTLVCELFDQLGGTQTVGLLGKYYQGNRVGFTAELDLTLKQYGAVLNQMKSEYYRNEIEKAGGAILYGVMGTGVLTSHLSDSKKQVLGASVVLRDGTRGLILANVVIDATGNADLAAAGGAPTLFGSEILPAETVYLQGTSINWRDLGTSTSNQELTYTDDTKSDSLHNAITDTLRRFGVYRWDFAPFAASRERRRLNSSFAVRLPDIVRNKHYADTITVASAALDSHGPLVHPLTFLSMISHPNRLFPAEIPYRALLPDHLDNLLVTGLGISAERDALSIVRMQADVQNQGYAAGYAAAMAVRNHCSPAEIKIRELQAHLVQKGILRPEVLQQSDSPPLTKEQLTKLLPSICNSPNREGIEEFFAAGNAGRAVVEEAFRHRDAMTHEQRLSLALIGAILYGMDHDADLIAAELRKPVSRPGKKDSSETQGNQPERKPVLSLWDAGYPPNICYGERISDKDRMLIALARAKYRTFQPELIRMLQQLESPVPFSHLRAIAMYLDAVPSSDTVPELARILQQIPPMAAGMQPVSSDPKEKKKEAPFFAPLNELMLARTLFRLGDSDGLAKKRLMAYGEDPRIVYRDFARQVLKEGRMKR